MTSRGWFRLAYWLCLVGRDLGVVFEVHQNPTANRDKSLVFVASDCVMQKFCKTS